MFEVVMLKCKEKNVVIVPFYSWKNKLRAWRGLLVLQPQAGREVPRNINGLPECHRHLPAMRLTWLRKMVKVDGMVSFDFRREADCKCLTGPLSRRLLNIHSEAST